MQNFKSFGPLLLTIAVFCAILQTFLVSGAAVTELEKIPEVSSYKCIYKGLSYNVGDELPTHGICWHCVCREGFVEPNHSFCAQIDCPPPKFGCVVTHDENSCCPVYNNCSEGPQPPDTRTVSTHFIRPDRCHYCDQRYFRHYEAKSCMPVYDEGCECPKGFDCPEHNPGEEDTSVCRYKGNTYAFGDSIPTSNPCEICSCLKDYHSPNSVSLSCIGVECGSMFRSSPLGDTCYEVFEEGRCCPTTVKCGDSETHENGTDTVERTCDFEGKTYHLGQRMYSKENHCLSCLCDENFVDKSSNSCHIFECNIERQMHDLRSGCIPIYHEKTCCPIEYHCPTGTETGMPSSPIVHAAFNESDPLNHCTFDGKSYNVGYDLEINHPTGCVTCTCNTPPDFTCIHQSCEPPPNNDYENCRSIYVPGNCCPTYQCTRHSAPQRMCDPVKCEGDCVEVSPPYGCPMCQCQDLLCAPPKCLPGCEINYDVSPGSCPDCKCTGVSASIHSVCADVKCSPECFKGINARGCPMCICGPLCSPPKCDEGCHVQRNAPEGQCPGCECPDTTDNPSELRVLCAPVKCPPMCHEVIGALGCPSCKCDVLCSPPKCMAGCRMETPPYSGPCPGCVCGDKDKLTAVQCSPVHCSVGCSEVSVPNGCPMCHCSNILCSPPKCEEGCTVETEVPLGGCPGCKCPPSTRLDRPLCAPVKCGPQCYEAISPQGCPMCVCGPLCSPPKCDEGCKIQTDVPAGECPGCVCDTEVGNTETHRVLCSPVLCPSYCSKGIGNTGCETCVCQPMCSPPKCNPGCRVETVPSIGPCPGCDCDSSHDPLIQCSPVKCDPGCTERIDFAQGPCPFCFCEDDDRSQDGVDLGLYGIRCSPPKCQPGCYPKRIPPAVCQTCFCDDGKDLYGIQCSPPKCDPGCVAKLIPPGPCPSCSCEDITIDPFGIQCSPPKCDPGCVAKLIPPGPCPSCSCEDRSIDPFGIQCSPPKCDPGCVAKLIPPGPCPSCSCEDSTIDPFRVLCSPPKCAPGCVAKLIPPGPCPSCSCEHDKSPFGIQCSPPKCEPGCIAKLIPPGPCPSCSCEDGHMPSMDIQCAPVKCAPGCHTESSAAPGTCPRCVCDGRHFRALDMIQCTPPRCDLGCYPKVVPPSRCASCYCREGGRARGMECPQMMPCHFPCRTVKMTPTSCPVCICNNFPLCTIPQCNPECTLEISSTSGCHECKCPEDAKTEETQDIQCAPVSCGGASCRQITNRDGCPVCQCDPLCSKPRCRPGCPAKLDRSLGPCPACTC